jgi:hypothetical protein
MNEAAVQRTAEPSGERRAADAQSPARLAGSASTVGARAGWVVALLVAVAAASVLAYLSRRAADDGTRLAIMPFDLAASAEQTQERSRLALVSETLMVDLARDGAGLEIIGPRTTAKYRGFPRRLVNASKGGRTS